MASVKDVRTTARTAAAAAVTAAQQALATADGALVTAQATLATATDALATLQAAAAGIEQSLATAAMPADQHQLELDLEANLLDQQPARAALAAAQDGTSAALLARQRAGAALDRAKADLVAAEAALAAATVDDDAANAWRAVLQGQALAATITTANDQATTDLVNHALDTLAIDLGDPATLALVRSRWADATSQAAERVAVVDRTTAARAALDAAADPTAGAVASTLADFGAARDAARWAAELAIPQLAWAVGQLAAVTGGAGAPTAAEQDRITARAQAAQGPAAHEQAVHDAQVSLRTANAEFDRKALLAEAADPNFDRNTDASLDNERQAVQQADQDLQNARNGYPQNEADTVDAWEVTLPDPLLAVTTDSLRAIAIVDRVKKLYPNAPGPNNEKSLVQALADTEVSYAAAIEAVDAHTARRRAADDRIVAAVDAVAALATVADQRIAASVRGDG